MKLKFRRPVVLLILILVVIIFLASMYLVHRNDRRSNKSSYFSTRCIDYKQKDFSRRLNDRIVDYSAEAKLRGIKECRDDNDLNKYLNSGKLVKVKSCSSYIVEKMTFSYPCVTSGSKELIDEIAMRLRDKASSKGLNGVKFYITSMTRKTGNVKSLRRLNGNASANSPHLYGNAFDISYKRFIARKWFLTNCDKKFLKEALAEVIWQLRSEKKCWATYEKIQNCFHVVER